MGLATGIVKNLVFLLNFLCSIVGLVLIVVGSLAVASLNKLDAATKQNSTFAPAFLIALGVLIFIVSFLGCCGVCQRNQCMLITYSVILILFFVVQLGLGIYGYIHIDSSNTTSTVKHDITTQLDIKFQDYKTNDSSKHLFNDLQYQLKCCGVQGPKDYEKIFNPLYYPGTCCGLKETDQCSAPKYTQGCAEAVFQAINHSLKIVAYVALGICVTEIVAALLAICLVNSYRNETRRGM